MKMKLNLHRRHEAAPFTRTNRQTSIQSVREAMHYLFASARRDQQRLVHLALNEAEALAWQTPFPQLVFPTLAEEKVRAVAAWQSKQDFLLESEPAVALAA